MLSTTLTKPEAPSGGETIKVEVVDDDAAIRQLLRMMLELEGFIVVEADNGKEGVAIAAKHRPDFVILDYMMPEMDGEKAGRAIRSVAPQSVIIAFSAHLIRDPYWSDLFLPKGRIGEMPSLIESELMRRKYEI